MNKLKEINGKYYQECEVVMLATNEKGFTLNINSQRVLHIPFDPNTPQDYIKLKNKPQHLYFLSNEKIKEGELFIDLREKTPDKEYIYTAGLGGHAEFANKIGKKIIVTTDISLLKSYSEQTLNDFACLPQPSKEFLQAYIKAYNESKPITKVLVEMEPIGAYCNIEYLSDFSIKVNSSNEITIKKIKDSYTREEVNNILEEYRTHLDEYPSVRTSKKYLTNFTEKYL